MSLIGLFDRQVTVQMGPEGHPGANIVDLRVGFKVEYKAAKTCPTATVRVYNPAPTSVAWLHIPLAVIRLLVGYDPMPRAIFTGTPVRGGIDMKAEGPDRVLVVDAADGGPAYTETFIQVSFTTPTTFGQVLALVLAQTQWVRGYVDPTIEAVQLPHGIVLLGRPAEVMDRLAAAALVKGAPIGADWFVRDGALYVVGRGDATPEVAPLLSAGLGNLIGSPVQTKKGVKVRALIDATMRPGRSFWLAGDAVSGAYVCKDVTFTGDSGFDNPYYMDITGTPLGMP